MIRMNRQKLRLWLLTYISLPIMVFLLGYLRWYWGIPGICALSFAFYCAVHEQRTTCSDTVISISWWEMLFWIVFVLLFTHLCGLSGFWYQTTDWNARNPIYKDIITRPWPVFYEGRNTALSYYIGFWLVPAVPAKLVYMLFGVDAGWMMGHFTLWLWSALGLLLILLSIFLQLDSNSLKSRCVSSLTVLLFSGLDIVGVLIYRERYLLEPGAFHLEWWYLSYEFSSITTCLCWVFNQTMIPWICVLIFLTEKSSRNYLLIGTACLFCGPFPFVGLIILMFARFFADCAAELRNRGSAGNCIRDAFSPQNLIVLCFVFPLAALYLLSNNAAAEGLKTDISRVVPTVGGMLLFFVLEVGIYWGLLWKEHRKDVLFYAVVGTLLMCPFIRIGQGDDFCMRVSVPGIFLMAIWCAKRICAFVKNGFPKPARERIAAITLTAALIIGSVTPIVELYRGVYYVVSKRTIFLGNREYDTLEEYPVITVNFEATAPESRVFYHYFAKSLVGGRGKTMKTIAGDMKWIKF